jgi:hypothetical protein
MSSAENHSMIALSPKTSYLKTSNLCTRVHFLSKITSVFKNCEWYVSGFPGRNIRPPGRNIRGAGLSGSPWPDNPAGVAAEYKRGGVGLPSGQFQPQPLGFPQPPPPPLRHRCRSSGHPLGRSSPEVVLLHLGRAFTKPFLEWMRVFS